MGEHMEKDTSYRLRLPSKLLQRAHEKAEREDLALAQVMRRFLSAWVDGSIILPQPTDPQPEAKAKRSKP
jgi:hypothetical protein